MRGHGDVAAASARGRYSWVFRPRLVAIFQHESGRRKTSPFAHCPRRDIVRWIQRVVD